MHKKTDRRDFLKKTGILTGAIGLAGNSVVALSRPEKKVKNIIPKWKGFNILDFFSPNPRYTSRGTTEQDLQWMSDWGFDFIRIPMAYPSYLDIDRSIDIKPEDVYKVSEEALEKVDNIVYMAHKYNIHVSLNLHRAPGYCINAGFHEPYNLWKDKEAQEAFYWHWSMWAKRYKNISREKISFDLLNEPAWIEDMNDQFSSKTMVPGNKYAELVESTANAIWEENPDHMVIADGNQVGSKVIPEIAHLPIAQSCRGYYPHIISHYKAGWVFKPEQIEKLPPLKYPGEVNGQYLSREMLEEFYQPWIELAKSGVGVHCGECGCYKETPHDIFLAWFGDVVDILGSNDIGFALWNFRGDFGIMDSGRKDVDYEDWHGHKLDRKLLKLLQQV
ncbi:glycoside hydrolase family 5 protein [Bacteroidota bacterium]